MSFFSSFPPSTVCTHVEESYSLIIEDFQRFIFSRRKRNAQIKNNDLLGAPGAGGKWYKGSSADSTWNHDLLWKLRVEKEVNELHPDEHVEMIPDYTTGVADRKGTMQN